LTVRRILERRRDRLGEILERAEKWYQELVSLANTAK